MEKIRVCICEKPDLARNVAEALRLMGENVQYKKDDFTHHSENYVVCAAQGHLFELFTIEDYLGVKKEERRAWRMEDLPYKPSPYKFKISQGKKNTFNTIRKYVNSPQCTGIVHCGDADREGEIIVRIVIGMIGTKEKKVYRPWFQSQEPQDIKEAFIKMGLDSQYDNLASSGFARMYMDWFYGINGSRYLKLKTGNVAHFGRVKGAILKILYDRHIERENFVSETYYSTKGIIEKESGSVTLRSKKVVKKEQRNIALSMSHNYSSWNTVVKNITRKETTVKPPKLFSQTTLQSYMSKRHQIKPDTTLKICQKLYEGKFLTYPRTNTEYLASGEMERIKETIDIMKKAGFDGIEFRTGKDIFDDTKMGDESHSAITPTRRIPTQEDMKKLSADEKILYRTVLFRFMAVFCDTPFRQSVTTITFETGDINAGGEVFNVTGKETIEAGWSDIEAAPSSRILPHFSEGEILKVPFELDERKTEPPKLYTVESLNTKLDNPLTSDEKKQLGENPDGEGQEIAIDYEAIKKGLIIGTTATRADTIKTLIEKEYIKLEKTTYKILNRGIVLCENAEQLKIDIGVHQTVEFQKKLTAVANGEATTKDALDYTYNVVDQMMENGKNITLSKCEDRNAVGNCPRCGTEVIEIEKGFICKNKECKFALWKEDKFLQKYRIEISKKYASALLEKGKFTTTNAWSEKKQSLFPVQVKLKDTFDKEQPNKPAYVNYEFDFNIPGRTQTGRKGNSIPRGFTPKQRK